MHGGIGSRPMTEPRYKKVDPPKNLKDLPRFLKEVIGGFFVRLTYIFRLVWKTGPWILLTLVFISAFEGIMPLVGSYISKDILNELQKVISARGVAEITGVPFELNFFGSLLMFLVIFFFLHSILTKVVSSISSAVIRISGEKVTKYVRVEIMKKASEVDIASFDLPSFYEQLENANREAGMRPVSVLSSTLTVFSKIISLVSYIIVLAVAPGLWWMAPIVLVVSVPSAIINFHYRRKNFLYIRHRSKDRRKMNYYSSLAVNKDMVKEIRMFDLSDHFVDQYESVFSKYYKGLRSLIIRENVWHSVIIAISAIVNGILFAIVVMRVFEGELMLGDYSLYTGALTSIGASVTSLIATSASVYEGTLFIDNLMSFLNEKPTVVPSIEKPRKVEKGAPHTIEFRHVSFSYPGSSRKVLDDINLVFSPGETAVLVGLNGAGKTTLIKLLTRLYDPTEGEILLDGHDLREYDVKEYYNLFGIIFQDFGKYAESVSDNIRFGNIKAEEDKQRIYESARMANVDGYISTLPQGYETGLMKYFDPHGTELSIGQWQKLSVARAFYSDSDIVILDEPTASLDAIAEQEIFNQFDRLREGKMTVFVSHRLSSATVASKIVVLEGGRVVEEGTHTELMAQKGKYFELFSTQAKRYVEDSATKNKNG